MGWLPRAGTRRVSPAWWLWLAAIGLGLTLQGVRADDFRRMRTEPVPDLRTRVARQDPIRLWNGSGGRLQFEVGRLNGRVLWVVADERALHLSRGMQTPFYPGTRVRRIQGEILWIGLHSLPRRPSRALLTVFHRFGRQFRTTVFEIRGSPEGASEAVLRSRYSGDWQLIRPLGDRLYRQSLRPDDLWQPTINRLRTTSEGYRVEGSLPLPGGSRLIGTVLIPGNGKPHGSTGQRLLVTLDDSGRLILARGTRVLDQRKEDFGQGAVRLRARSPDHREIPLRIPPVYLTGTDLVGTAVNPPSRGGLQGWVSAGGSSRIQLFGLRGETLVDRGVIGPFPGRVLDLEVPPSNPDQLLWLRTPSRGRVRLEMLDLGSQSRIDPQ